jgi:hypothetical protein
MWEQVGARVCGGWSVWSIVRNVVGDDELMEPGENFPVGDGQMDGREYIQLLLMYKKHYYVPIDTLQSPCNIHWSSSCTSLRERLQIQQMQTPMLGLVLFTVHYGNIPYIATTRHCPSQTLLTAWWASNPSTEEPLIIRTSPCQVGPNSVQGRGKHYLVHISGSCI